MSRTNKERIICSAINVPGIETPICGLRHSDCFRILRLILNKYNKEMIVQGFITNKNIFVNRIEALEIAVNAKQISEKHYPFNILLSEDLY